MHSLYMLSKLNIHLFAILRRGQNSSANNKLSCCAHLVNISQAKITCKDAKTNKIFAQIKEISDDQGLQQLSNCSVSIL